jgi:GH24 family phage-related lysozyme (muramidase)
MEQTRYTEIQFDDPRIQELERLLNRTKTVGHTNTPTYWGLLEDELKNTEGFRHRTYIPTKGDRKTIGYGHTGEHAISGNYITKQEGNAILKKDIQDKHRQLVSEYPKFKSYPDDVKVPIMSSKYRGSFGAKASPNTLDYMNKGRYDEASREFLNHDEYRDAKAGLNDRAGIVPRMEKTSYAIKSLGTGLHPNRR